MGLSDFVIKMDASFKAFCQDVTFSVFFGSLLRIFQNFLEPFCLEAKSFKIFSRFQSWTALFIDGGGYLPFLEKLEVIILFNRRYSPSLKLIISESSLCVLKMVPL